MNNKIMNNQSKEIKIIVYVLILIIVCVVVGSAFAFFNYTKSGSNNAIETGYVSFAFDDGNAEFSKGNNFPVETSDVDNTLSKNFSLTAHTTFSQGIAYNIYVVYGDSVSGKTRFRDDVMTFQFIPPANGNGFTTTVNNYSSPSSLTFTNGKALISSGTIQNTSASTTKNYTVKMWIDSSKMSISSTTKRANNAEGNPSLADSTTGNTTATRYMTNDTSVASTVTLYPAITSQQGKIIYTTNEFANSYYSFKIVVEAYDIVNNS